MQPHLEVLYWGLKFSDWMNVAGLFLGPIVAVLITLWIDARRRGREQKLLILRALMTTRHLVGDPNYSAAINLIPIEFAGNLLVQSAYKEFVQSASTPTTDDTRDQVARATATKQGRLIFQVAKSMGYDIAESDIQTEAYAADALRARDNLSLDSQKAMRDIASILQLQARLMVNAQLLPQERQFLGLPEQEP